MNIFKERARRVSAVVPYFPLVVLVLVSVVIISSYILAGWLMRPVGDDYGALLAYHTGGLHWLTSLPHNLTTGGGRYGQTFVGSITYGMLGQQALRLTAFVSVGLFLLATYVAILAWQVSVGSRKKHHEHAACGALILFLLYTLLSIVYPWLRGGVDNSFQDFLWLPGVLTYTLPLELLVILLSLVVFFRTKVVRSWGWLIGLGLVSIFLGTFNEITPLLYSESILIVFIYCICRKRITLAEIRAIFKRLLPFFIVALGLLLGLLANYASAATAQRRDITQANAPLGHLITHSLRSTQQYISTFVAGGSATDHSALLFIIIAGIALGLFALSKLRTQNKTIHLKRTLLVCGGTLLMTISSIFVCFFAVFKGYGISNYSYLAPRFEIFYNIWLCLFLLALGYLLASIIQILPSSAPTRRALPLLYILLTLGLLLNVPRIMNQASSRLQTVAIFSAKWDYQNNELESAAHIHQTQITVPVIDIGDSYHFQCGIPSSDNWLGAVKQQYYHIPRICSDGL